MRARPQRSLDARRMLALAASLWLLVAVVLAARHEGQVAHVVDLATGRLVHADRLIGAHTGHASDFHAASHSGHGSDECGICAALHQAARPIAGYAGTAPPAASSTAPLLPTSQAVATRIGGYRLAPKTSPPAIG